MNKFSNSSADNVSISKGSDGVNNFSSESSIRLSSTGDMSSKGQGIPDANSTRTIDINIRNHQDLLRLLEYTAKFISLLQHTTFEDGMSNEAIEIVEAYYNRNSFATIMWVHTIYGQYAGQEHIIDSLLRIIAYIEFPASYINIFIPLLRSALSDNTMNCQESAIMLCETWRTIECLKALQDTQFATQYLEEYANKIIEELKNELNINVA